MDRRPSGAAARLTHLRISTQGWLNRSRDPKQQLSTEAAVLALLSGPDDSAACEPSQVKGNFRRAGISENSSFLHKVERVANGTHVHFERGPITISRKLNFKLEVIFIMLVLLLLPRRLREQLIKISCISSAS